MEFTQQTRELLESLSYLVTLLGIPIAIILFTLDKMRARRIEELEAHQQSNDRYIEYLARCLDEPDFSACEFRPDDKDVRASEVPCRTLVMFTILVAMMENAYLRYRYTHSATRRRLWSGWLGYMEEWAERPNFRAAWPLVSRQFDSGFVTLGDEIILKAKEKHLKEPPCG